MSILEVQKKKENKIQFAFHILLKLKLFFLSPNVGSDLEIAQTSEHSYNNMTYVFFLNLYQNFQKFWELAHNGNGYICIYKEAIIYLIYS